MDSFRRLGTRKQSRKRKTDMCAAIFSISNWQEELSRGCARRRPRPPPLRIRRIPRQRTPRACPWLDRSPVGDRQPSVRRTTSESASAAPLLTQWAPLQQHRGESGRRVCAGIQGVLEGGQGRTVTDGSSGAAGIVRRSAPHSSASSRIYPIPFRGATDGWTTDEGNEGGRVRNRDSRMRGIPTRREEIAHAISQRLSH